MMKMYNFKLKKMKKSVLKRNTIIDRKRKIGKKTKV